MTRWWQSPIAIAAAAIGATVPLWFVRLPPLIDLLGHMGRYHVQLNLAANPLLRANWDYHWRLVGNLGCDLLMEGLGRTFGVERGAVILAAFIPALMIFAMARLARGAHGHVPATAWAAFPFAMSYCWQYGLVNYWLGVALALLAASAFGPRSVAQPRGAGRLRSLVLLAGTSLMLWVAHVYGWALFAILIAARRAGAMPVRRWPALVPDLLPLAAPVALMVALGYGQPKAETLAWGQFGYKALALLWTLRDQWQWLDLGSLIAATLLICVGFRSKSFAVDRGLALASLGVFVALMVLPYQLLGSAYADARLWPVVYIVALLAIRPAETANAGLSGALAASAALVFAVRIAATTIGFQSYDQAFARHLAAFDTVPRGARVAVFTQFTCSPPWRRPRLEHLDGIAMLRRDLFTNGQWDVPGAQSLVAKGALGTPYNADPSQLVRTRACHRDLRPVLLNRIKGFPRDRFDYVWVTGFVPSTLPRYAGLVPMFADEATILYRVEK
jgi:hypothetical protein